MRCPRAFAERYIRGEREFDEPWESFETAVWDKERSEWRLRDGRFVPSKAKSAALGKAMHALLEAWHKHEPVDWRSFPGQVANAGLHHVPHPTLCERTITEGHIGAEPLPAGVRADLSTGFRAHGVLWVGLMDLLAWPTREELTRLGVPARFDLVLNDYKSTASIDDYALTPEELFSDTQANLYALWVRRLTGAREVPANWVYFETKAVRRAAPTRTILNTDHADEVIGVCAQHARALDLLVTPEDAEQNPLACSDYGPPGKINCKYHVANGGHCRPPRKSIGALIQARIPKKENTNMAVKLSEAAQKKLAEIEAKKKAAAAQSTASASEPEPNDPGEVPGERDVAPAEESEPSAEDETAARDVAPAASEPVKPAPAPKAPARKAAAKADGSAAANVIALSAELATAKANADAAAAKVSEIMAAIAKACAS